MDGRVLVGAGDPDKPVFRIPARKQAPGPIPGRGQQESITRRELHLDDRQWMTGQAIHQLPGVGVPEKDLEEIKWVVGGRVWLAFEVGILGFESRKKTCPQNNYKEATFSNILPTTEWGN